jgi:protein-tyrosine phosphatase
VPGLDDGAADLEAAVEMARLAAADGTRKLAATPHVRDDYPTTAEQMERGVEAVREAIERAGIELEVVPGGELAIEQAARLEPAELRRFGLGGSDYWLLLEFPYEGWPLGLARLAQHLGEEDFGLVLAHPERNAEVQALPSRLHEFVDAGMLVQITAASLDGRLGRRARAAGRTLLELGLAHLLASDAHAPSVRAVGLSAAAREIGNAQLSRWLTEDVPAAITSCSPLPERPTGA